MAKRPVRSFISVKSDMDDIQLELSKQKVKAAKLIIEYIVMATDANKSEQEKLTSMETLLKGLSMDEKYNIMRTAVLLLAKEV